MTTAVATKTTLAEQLFFEAFEKELLETVERSPNVSEWSVAGKFKSKARPSGEDIAWWREAGPPMVQAWIDWRNGSDWEIWTTPDGVKAVELEIECQIAGTKLVMTIDRVMRMPNGGLVIVDLKAGRSIPSSDLQLGVYRYGLWRRYGVWAKWGGYWMARLADIELLELSRYTPELVEGMMTNFAKARRHNIFIPNPSRLCRPCSMRDHCFAVGGSKAHLVPQPRG